MQSPAWDGKFRNSPLRSDVQDPSDHFQMLGLGMFGHISKVHGIGESRDALLATKHKDSSLRMIVLIRGGRKGSGNP